MVYFSICWIPVIVGFSVLWISVPGGCQCMVDDSVW